MRLSHSRVILVRRWGFESRSICRGPGKRDTEKTLASGMENKQHIPTFYDNQQKRLGHKLRQLLQSI